MSLRTATPAAITGITGPVVTNADRDWALAQKPRWARLHAADDDLEMVDDDAPLDAARRAAISRREPSWFNFVSGEIERFERFFAGQRKSYAEWSVLWRKGWWPKRREERAFPRSARRSPQPFVRRGTPEFDRAMALGSAEERRMWERFGVAQFKPDDRRLPEIFAAPVGAPPPGGAS